jgi:hypothetical protein
MLFLLGALLGLLLGLPAWLATSAGMAAVARLPQQAHASGVIASR